MSARFEELDWQPTPMGDLVLRRRLEASSGVDVFEVKLGDEFLMSSLFTVAEEELATLGLAATTGQHLRVLVGGLGLGYTAAATLRDARVESMVVVDAMPAVIGWHEQGLLPMSTTLTGDPRTHFVEDDFFAMMRRTPSPAERFHAVLLDVDHSPRHHLNSSHADFYEVPGLRRLTRWLLDDGVFGLWSDDPPDDEFLKRLSSVFSGARAHVVQFENPVTDGTSSNTVYIAAR